MIEMLNRKEFTDYFNSLDSRLGQDHSALWMPETIGDRHISCEWFVCVQPLVAHLIKEEFFDWCGTALDGEVRCFSSDTQNQREWWGFTNRNDALIWCLKWA